MTPNYLALMALGGVIGAVGLVSEGVTQSIAFVAASVIAPGFEPIAKIPLGLVLRRWNVVKRGLISTLAGYSVLVLGAAVAFFILDQTATVSVDTLLANPEVTTIAHPSLADVLVSLCAAAAGMIMIAAYRRSVIAGPLIALILVPAAALSGMGISARQPQLVLEGLQRLGIDVLLIVGVGALVVFIKQATVHRRAPIV